MGKMMLPVLLERPDIQVCPHTETPERRRDSFPLLLAALTLLLLCTVLSIAELRAWQANVLQDALSLLRQPAALEPDGAAVAEVQMSDIDLASDVQPVSDASRLMALATTPVAATPNDRQTRARPSVTRPAQPPETLLKSRPLTLDQRLHKLIEETQGQGELRRARLLELYRQGDVNVRLLELLAQSYAEARQWQHVALLQTRILRLQPGALRHHYNLAVALDRSGQTAKAIAAYQHLISESGADAAFDLDLVESRLAFLQGEKNARRTTDRTWSD